MFGGSGGLFGSSAPGATAAPATSGGGLFGSTGATQGMFGGQTGTQSLFGQTSGTSGDSGGLFGTKRPTTGDSLPQFGTSGQKKFLPGRPSLQDILAVAPSWKASFDAIHKELADRDAHLANLKSLVKDVRTKNESQRELLAEKIELSKSHLIAQNTIESNIDSLQPTVRKLHRQCTTLAASCQRTIGLSNQAPQSLVVPQSEYLRFINDMSQRSQALQERATALQTSLQLLSDEARGSVSSPISEIKTTLELLLAEFRQLKLRQLGLHDELESSIERHKQTNRLGPDFDKVLIEDAKSNLVPLAADVLDRRMSDTTAN